MNKFYGVLGHLEKEKNFKVIIEIDSAAIKKLSDSYGKRVKFRGFGIDRDYNFYVTVETKEGFGVPSRLNCLFVDGKPFIDYIKLKKLEE